MRVRRRRRRQVADRGDAVADDADVGAEPRRAGAVDDPAVGDDDVEPGRCRGGRRLGRRRGRGGWCGTAAAGQDEGGQQHGTGGSGQGHGGRLYRLCRPKAPSPYTAAVRRAAVLLHLVLAVAASGLVAGQTVPAVTAPPQTRVVDAYHGLRYIEHVEARAAPAAAARRADRPAHPGAAGDVVARGRRSRGRARDHVGVRPAAGRAVRRQRPLLPALSVRRRRGLRDRPGRLRGRCLLGVRDARSSRSRWCPTLRHWPSTVATAPASCTAPAATPPAGESVSAVTVWTAVSGSAQVVTDGVVTVPQYPLAGPATRSAPARPQRALRHRPVVVRRGQCPHAHRPVARSAQADADGRRTQSRQRGSGRRRGGPPDGRATTACGTRSISTAAGRARWCGSTPTAASTPCSTRRRTTRPGGASRPAWRCSRGRGRWRDSSAWHS